jgi:hypothetical protein
MGGSGASGGVHRFPREEGEQLEKKEPTGGVRMAGREREKGCVAGLLSTAGLIPSRVGPGCPFLYFFFFFPFLLF